jgi:phosphoribosylformylglycinamidine synthase
MPTGPLPSVKAAAVRDAQEAVRVGIRSAALTNAHDIAEGGLAVALAECCIAGGIGATVSVDLDVFGEAPGCGFIVSGPEEALAGFRVVGRVGGDALEIVGQLKLAVSELRAAWERGLGELV